MYNGFIYEALDWVIVRLKYLNLLEFFKFTARLYNKTAGDVNDRVKFSRIGADIYIIFKWVVVLLIWLLKLHGYFFSLVTWYLIVSNVYTFFYYFIWKDEQLVHFDAHRDKRRFIHLLQAIIFSQVAFASLYSLEYYYDFAWSAPVKQLNSFWLSVANSVAGNYNQAKPATPMGETISKVQSLITFIYLTVIISKAVPNNSR